MYIYYVNTCKHMHPFNMHICTNRCPGDFVTVNRPYAGINRNVPDVAQM